MADDSVFVTGQVSVPLTKNSVRSDMIVAKYSGSGVETWTEYFVDHSGRDIEVIAPPSSPASIYISGYHMSSKILPSGFVEKLTESSDRNSVVESWTLPFGEYVYPLIALGTDPDQNSETPSIYVSTMGPPYLSATLMKINDAGDTWNTGWSTSITSSSKSLGGTPYVDVDGTTVFCPAISPRKLISMALERRPVLC